MGTLTYIKNFLQDKDVAAIAPSSSFLVRRVCRKMDFSRPLVVVEYGPGNGVFSKHILERLHPDSRFVMIEKNPSFARELQPLAEDPRVTVVEGSVVDVLEILERLGIDKADYILSGIPFSFLKTPEKDRLLEDTREALAQDGAFLVYQNYNHMEKPLRRHFEHVEKEYELINIPPMYAYKATK